jgi:uncharacterized membrane protein HdeD (DUF308 family)
LAVIDGILTIIFAVGYRRELSGRWEWMMQGGVMDLVLATIIISRLPDSLTWALGLLVGTSAAFKATPMSGRTSHVDE